MVVISQCNCPLAISLIFDKVKLEKKITAIWTVGNGAFQLKSAGQPKLVEFTMKPIQCEKKTHDSGTDPLLPISQSTCLKERKIRYK